MGTLEQAIHSEDSHFPGMGVECPAGLSHQVSAGSKVSVNMIIDSGVQWLGSEASR